MKPGDRPCTPAAEPKSRQTQRRIVEAAVDLHGTDRARAHALSMVAERAGVQRHTLYAHFPDERSLCLACSGLAAGARPAARRRAVAAASRIAERLRAGLAAIYAWYERNADVTDSRAPRRQVSSFDEGDRRAAVRTVDGRLL